MRQSPTGQGKRSGHNVTRIDTRNWRKSDPNKAVTQLMLARIQQLESAVRYYQEEVRHAQTRSRKNILERTLDFYRQEFKDRWKELRTLVVGGAEIERGPIRAFLKKTHSRMILVVK